MIVVKYIKLTVVLILLTSPAYGLQPHTKMNDAEFRVRWQEETYKAEGLDKWEREKRYRKMAQDINMTIVLCAECKSILEVKEGQGALSHGTCGECMLKMFPELVDDKEYFEEIRPIDMERERNRKFVEDKFNA